MRILRQAPALVTSVAILGCGSAEVVDDHDGPLPPDAARVCINADPSQAGPDDTCGVFVSSTFGSDDNSGTLEHPVRSLGAAFALALRGARRVYACAEVFEEQAEIPAGVELWGGLDCADGWMYVGATKKTTIAPGEAGVIPLRLLPGDGVARAIDVRAEAADGVQPSESSIAAIVLPGARVEILRSELAAGDGAPGVDGEQGGGSGALLTAEDGATGLPGADACGGDVVPGGASVVTECDGVESIGGKGGDGHMAYGTAGEHGQPMPASPDGIHGEGGGGQNGSHAQCAAGHVGHAGQDGEHGLGAAGMGRLTLAGWEGERGQDGGNGRPGQGGGGGGASRGPLYYECGAGQPQAGASGGSGGSGGCGGKGGKGGGYGGASIGLISLSDDVTVRATIITTGDGGDGGRGGLWQGGGQGGQGALGGVGVGSSVGACGGGRGGQGGNGGHGGGGLGGVTLGIVHVVEQPVTMEGVMIDTGRPGKGGLGGSPHVTLPGTTGEDGLDASVQSFPAPAH